MANFHLFNVGLDGRPAVYRPNKFAAKRLGIEPDTEVNVTALGLYQVTDGDEAGPYFIIELEDGRCRYAAPDEIQFVDRGVTRA